MLKTVLVSGLKNFNINFLEIVTITNVQLEILGSSAFHSIMTKEKKEFLDKLLFTVKRGNLSLSQLRVE